MKSDSEADTAATDSDGTLVSKVKSVKKLVRKVSQPDADADSFATDAEAASDAEVAPKDGRFLDITSFNTGLPFDATAAKILPTSALVVRHLLNSGSKDVDALYYVHDRRFQEDGVLCECTFVVASGKAHSDFQNIRKGRSCSSFMLIDKWLPEPSQSLFNSSCICLEASSILQAHRSLDHVFHD